MAKSILSHHSLVEKANKSLVIVISIAVFLVVFSLVAMKSLISQASYQSRVISQQKKSLKILKANTKAADELKTSFKAFDDATQNAIGGLRDGTTSKDGSNAKIILDALPSTYDFPALITNIETLFAGKSVKLLAVSGTDNELQQASTQASANPTPVPIPFEISFEGDYAKVQEMIIALEKSIRPVKILSMDISGGQEKLTVQMKAESVYQPTKKFNVTKTVVK